MNELARQAQEITEYFDKLNINIDVFKEHPTGRPDEPVRLYISSKPMGGPLAVNNGEGWTPIYPEKPNSYPLKGKWFSPSTSSWGLDTWKAAVTAALNPKAHDFGELGNRIARDRAAKNRNPFRSAVLSALLQER